MNAVRRGSQILAMAVCVGAATFSAQHASAQTSLLNVSYDPTRELYAQTNPLFAADWRKRLCRCPTLAFVFPDSFPAASSSTASRRATMLVSAAATG